MRAHARLRLVGGGTDVWRGVEVGAAQQRAVSWRRLRGEDVGGVGAEGACSEVGGVRGGGREGCVA